MLTMMAEDFHQIYNAFFDGFQLSRHYADRTEQLPVPRQAGEGALRRFVPRPDLEIVISDYTLTRNRQFQLRTDSAMVELSFCLQGKRELHISGMKHEFRANRCTLQLVDRFHAHFDFDGNQPMLAVGIGIPVATFDRFMEDFEGKRAVDFAKLVDRRSFRLFEQTIEPAASVILQQILDASYSNETRKIYMESKALELLSLSFHTLLWDREPDDKHIRSKLSKSDLEKIRQAQEVLLHSMDSPPSLLELSRTVGLNDFKLKIGFKEVYGHTVFGYLREKRLEKALLLLQKGQVNVNQAACVVGYSNPSHFAEVFREKYGFNPGELVRK